MKPLRFNSPLKPRVTPKREPDQSPVSWWTDPVKFYANASEEQKRLRRIKQVYVPKDFQA